METTILNFGMFSEAGNKAVTEKIYNKVIQLPITATDKEIYSVIRKGIEEVDKEHKEVFDTEVFEMLIQRIRKATGRKTLTRLEF